MNIKSGLGDFWENLSAKAINALWKMYTPTANNVLEYLLMDTASQMEEKAEAYLKRYIRSLSANELAVFV